MSLEIINVHWVIAEMALLDERILAEQQLFNINAAKTLKLAKCMYTFMARFDAFFPPQLIEGLGQSIALEDYDKIQEISQQVIALVSQLLKNDSGQ
jgi:hypothetical protein